VNLDPDTRIMGRGASRHDGIEDHGGAMCSNADLLMLAKLSTFRPDDHGTMIDLPEKSTAPVGCEWS
jgi:hypothetical protein